LLGIEHLRLVPCHSFSTVKYAGAGKETVKQLAGRRPDLYSRLTYIAYPFRQTFRSGCRSFRIP
jgi:hypothetical protein